MDVTALYPSISKELATRCIKKTVKESKIPWCDINIKQLGRYVALTSNNSELEEVGLEDNLTHGQLPTQTICYIYTECNVTSRYFLVSGLFF